MSKGDHVFNNVVTKMLKAFEAGFVEYICATKKPLKGADPDKLIRDKGYRNDWMSRTMPRTWALLEGFRDDPQLVTMRARLQTSTYRGGDVNTNAYSEHAQEFELAVVAFFRKTAMTGSILDENTILPVIARVRRAFQQMNRDAEDPGATERLLEQHKDDRREHEKITQDINAVRESLSWAWARCERVFRMAANELLRLQ